MKKYITILAAVVAMVACQKEDKGLSQVGDGQMRFEFGINVTKATATAFEAGDEVALFAVERTSADEAPELQIAGNFLNNEKIIYNGEAWASVRTLYWGANAGDFYALYPYQKLTSVKEQVFEVAMDQNTAETEESLGGYEASDLLWAKTENAAQADGTVAMQFKHLMSKCVVTLTKGETFEGDIPDDIVTHIYNTTTTAKLNFAKGSVEKDGTGNRRTITMKKINNERFEAIVVPQKIERSTPLIEITMGGIAYLLEHSLSFKPGYVHTINLTLNTSPDQEKFEIKLDAEVDDWN